MNDASSSPTLVLIHGLLSSPEEFALIARTLRERQVRFEFLHVPGYTCGDRKRPVSWHGWVEAAGDALDRRFAAGSAIVLGGLCVGGAIAVALASGVRLQDVHGVAMLSPTFAYDGWGASRWRHLRRIGYWLGIARFISIREREPYGIRNPKIRKWVVRALEAGDMSPIGPARIPLWGLRESERLYRFGLSRLPHLAVPLLVLHARADEIATVGSVERALRCVEGRAKLIVLEHSYHMITIDDDRQQVARELADFVDATRVDAPPTAVASTLPIQPARTRRASWPMDALLPAKCQAARTK